MSMLQMRDVQMARPDKPARAKKVAPPSARAATRRVNVSSPTVPGAQESVLRTVNTIEHMRQRKQITAHSYHAAERMWQAYETIYGQTGGVMDMDRSRGGGSPGSPPLPPYLEAAETLSFAKRILYPMDYRIVTLVACMGKTIDEAAVMVWHRTPQRADKEEVGRRLRTGLRELADRWFGSDGKDDRREIVGERADVAYTVQAGTIAQGNAAHATGHKVFRK